MTIATTTPRYSAALSPAWPVRCRTSLPWMVVDHGASGRENIPVAYALDEATARQYAADLNEIGYVIVEDESGAVA